MEKRLAESKLVKYMKSCSKLKKEEEEEEKS